MMPRSQLTKGFFSLQVAPFWMIQVSWPHISFKPHGFQVLIDTALRIDIVKGAYAITVLGFGVALARIPSFWFKESTPGAGQKESKS